MATIKAGIVGYGNLGRSVEAVIKQTSDIELVGVFSRRDSLDTDAPVIPVADVAEYADKIDVLYLCLGSATDIPEQAPEFAKYACTVDTYDNHRDVARHYSAMQDVAEKAGNVAVVSTGWDPGMFSLNRVYAAAVLPGAQQNTFWGPGLSQGHSDALRRIEAKDVDIRFTIRDGRIATQPFDLSVGGISLNLSGSTGLDQTIDYTARVTLPEGSAGGILTAVDVGIGGSFSSPKITLDVKNAVKDAVSNAIGEKLGLSVGSSEGKSADEIRADAKAKGDKLVEEARAQRDKLVGKASGKLARIAAQASGDALVSAAEKQAQKLMEQAEQQIAAQQ